MNNNTQDTIRQIVEAVWRGASAAFGPDLVSWDGLDLEAREQLITQATGHLHDTGLTGAEVEKVQPRLILDGQPIDPDENLRQQLEAAKAIEELGEDPALYHAEIVAQHGAPLAKLVLDLDVHLAAGGMPPKRWTGSIASETLLRLQEAQTLARELLAQRNAAQDRATAAERLLANRGDT